MKPAALTAGITLVLVAAIALIIAGIALGGGWRWAGGVATATLVVPIAMSNIQRKSQGGDEK